MVLLYKHPIVILSAKTKAMQLAHSFHINFDKFINQASEETMHGGPLIDAHQIMESHF